MQTIDIPVEGYEDIWNPNAVYEKVKLADQHCKNGKFEAAAKLLAECAAVGNNEACFRLAMILKEREIFSLSRTERFPESEKLLLMLQTRHITYMGRVLAELADLYMKAEMYMSATGYLLWAKLEGEKIDPDRVNDYYRRFLKEQLDCSDDAHGAYILGRCLIKAGITEKGVYFLNQAIRYGQGQRWRGYAALDLAEAAFGYDDALSSEMFRLSAELGYPQILCRKKK